MTAPRRDQDVSDELKKVDVIGAVGTKKRGSRPYCKQHPYHWEVVFGYGTGSLANRSCGVSIFLRKVRLRQPRIKRVWTPPACIVGRAGAVTVWSAELSGATFVALHWPVRARNSREEEAYRLTCDAMVDWVMVLAA